MPTFAYSAFISRPSAQKCGGVQKKTIANRYTAVPSSPPVTAAQPTSGGLAPAAPPHTMFCHVRRLSQTVYISVYPTNPVSASDAASTLIVSVISTNESAPRTQPNTSAAAGD